MTTDIMTLSEVAEFTRVPVNTLRYYRSTGGGPRTFRLAGRVVAKRDDVQAWLDAAYEAGSK